MLKLFRKTRQNMIKENKASKYLLYAIGEIVLVVIGILIALQINSWQKSQNDKALEKRYLENIVDELKRDSIALNEIHVQLIKQSEAKNPVLRMMIANKKNDSLMEYFALQWRPIYPFKTLNATFEEMQSSSHLSIIKSNEVRESIIKMYNTYESLATNEEFLLGYFKNLIEVLAINIPNLYSPTIEDVLAQRNNSHVMNSIRLNGSYSRRENYKNALEDCTHLLALIRRYQSRSN